MSVVSNWSQMIKDEIHLPWDKKHTEKPVESEYELETPRRKGFDKFWPVITAGAGLFSDGYVNNVCINMAFIFFFFVLIYFSLSDLSVL